MWKSNSLSQSTSVLTNRSPKWSSPCAVVSANDGPGGKPGGRMILPAFGAFTGGMDAADPAILKALQPAQRIDAVVPAKGQLARFNLWNRAA